MWYKSIYQFINLSIYQFIKPQKYVVFLQTKAIGEANRGDEFRHSPHIQAIIVSYNIFLNQTVIFMLKYIQGFNILSIRKILF
jgi:hypothetical protein